MSVAISARGAGLAAPTMVGALAGASLWLDLGALESSLVAGAVRHTFSPATISAFIVCVMAGALLTLAFHIFVVRRRLRPGSDVSARGAETLYLVPLSLVGVNLLGLGMLLEPLRTWWTPVAYVAIDMRVPIIVIGALLSAAILLTTLPAPTFVSAAAARWRDLDAATRSVLAEFSLAALVVAVAVASSPHARFSAHVNGDEPKYIRFCENWWQGHGMAIDYVADVSALPADHSSRLLQNAALAGPAFSRLASHLAADASAVVRGEWNRRFNTALSVGNNVVRGKEGGYYQIHGPGLSALILPAYALDRWLFDRRSSRFADDLFVVNLAFLGIYAALAVAIFRMAEAASGSSRAAAIAAGGVTLSLPVAAFPFQFYPETTAAAIVCVVTRRVLMPGPLSRSAAIAIGAALAFLGWLHVRFLGVWLVTVLWAAWTFRREKRPLVWLLGASGAVLAALCLYVYHVTGSLIPSAMFTAEGSPPGFDGSRVAPGLLASALDREYGLLPLAPFYALALPGIGLMLRRQPRTAAMLAAIALALIVPAMGRGYWGVGTVPLRHSLAVLPLAAIPIALWLRHHGARPLTAAAAVLLTALSIRTAVAYSLQNDKTITTMVDSSFSGWDASLLFPLIRRIGWPPGFDTLSMALALGAIVAAVAYGASARATAPSLAPPRVYISTSAAVTAAFVLLGMLAIAIGGPSYTPTLLLD